MKGRNRETPAGAAFGMQLWALQGEQEKSDSQLKEHHEYSTVARKCKKVGGVWEQSPRMVMSDTRKPPMSAKGVSQMP